MSSSGVSPFAVTSTSRPFTLRRIGCIVSRQQIFRECSRMGAEEWRHFSDTEKAIRSLRARTINGRGGMNWTAYLFTLALSVSMSLGAAISSQAQQANMSFFVTSVGSGKGADLGGLPGADQHCLRLAQAAGAGNHTWHAYL